MNSESKKTIVKKINDNTFLSEIKKVHYSNIIARMISKFTLEEEKALHIIFSYIKPFNYQNSTIVQIEKKIFFEHLELIDNNKYKRYEKLIVNLIGKTMTKIDKPETNSKLIGVIIYSSQWYNRKPIFEIKLNPDFMPYLEQLKEHYTRVDLNTVCAFRSKHALTLYKFLCSWTNDSKKENKRYLTTKDLKELFGLSIDDYVYNGKFVRSLFEKYTIAIAINEINKYSDININYDKKKENGKVKKYEFIWTQKEKPVEINKSNQKQKTMSKEQINNILTNIDKDDDVVFDK